jgi:hypothetical protein
MHFPLHFLHSAIIGPDPYSADVLFVLFIHSSVEVGVHSMDDPSCPFWHHSVFSLVFSFSSIFIVSSARSFLVTLPFQLVLSFFLVSFLRPKAWVVVACDGMSYGVRSNTLYVVGLPFSPHLSPQPRSRRALIHLFSALSKLSTHAPLWRKQALALKQHPW